MGTCHSDSFQVGVLKEAKRVHPDSWWWLKADGCDVVSGLKESVKNEWSGDVDQNDGRVRELHAEYKECLMFLEAVGVGARRTRRVMISDLHHLQENLETHLMFLSSSKNSQVFVDFACIAQFSPSLSPFLLYLYKPHTFILPSL